MAINFPSSPTLNQTFSANNVTYTWDGTKWNASTGFVSFSLSDKIQEGDTYTEVVDNGASNSYETVVIDGVERVRVKSSGQVSFSGSGSAAAPTLAIATDTNGVYSPGTNQIAIATNSTGRLFVDANGLVDILTSVSTGSLRISTNTTNATTKLGRIVGRPFTNADGDFLAFDIRGVSATENGINYGGGSSSLKAVNVHSFYTASNTTTTQGTERLRIGPDGKIGIGTITPGALLSTEGFNSYRGNAYTIATFTANNTLAPLNIVQSTNGTHPGISAGQTSAGVYGPLQLLTSETVRMHITNNGYIGINEVEPFANLTVAFSEPSIGFKETDAAANNQRWYFRPINGEFYFQALNDAGGGGGNMFSFTRSAQEINQIRGYAAGNQWLTIDNPTRRLGINTTAPGHELDVAASSSVGTTAGNSQNVANIKAAAGANNCQIIFSHERRSNGTDWLTTLARMRRWVDLTPMAYIDLGSGEGTFDRGQDIVFGNYDGEAVRIRRSGCIGVRNGGSDSIGVWVQGSMLASGDTSGYSFASNQTIPNNANLWVAYNSYISTVNAASAYTTNIIHHNSSTGIIGTNCTVAENIGFNIYSGGLVQGTNNAGFKFENQDIPAGKNVWGIILNQNAGNGNRWNLYAGGTAPNYFAGRVSIGDGTATGPKLTVNVVPVSASSDGLTLNTFGTARNFSIHSTGTAYDYNGVKANEHLIYSGGANLGILADGYDFKICTGTSEKYRITTDGVKCYNQPDPTTRSSSGSLTVADLKPGIIQYTGAAGALLLPTGTSMEGGFSSIYTNMAFEWSVINTGSGACSIGGNTGHTVIGNSSVSASSSGRFVSRRTGANTFVTYRLS